jgi:predicted ATPase
LPTPLLAQMTRCECAVAHQPRRVVLTGGPGAGKTAVLELIRKAFCEHVVVLPESAGILFGGGFPRRQLDETRRAAQRAIYYVQRELESAIAALAPAVMLCDRGTVDGHAYWPGPDDFWQQVGTTREAELSRYDAVIHLRAAPDAAYNHSNPLRLESAAEARAIDDRIAKAWESHPRRMVIEAEDDFLTKASNAIELIKQEVPACCRAHLFPSCKGHMEDEPAQPQAVAPADRVGPPGH